MKITYFGTTTLLFDDGKDQILFDESDTIDAATVAVAVHDAVTNMADSFRAYCSALSFSIPLSVNSGR